MKNILIGDIKKMFAYIKRNQKNLIALSKEYKQNIINANLIKELYIHHGKIEAEENEYLVDPENEDINGTGSSRIKMLDDSYLLSDDDMRIMNERVYSRLKDDQIMIDLCPERLEIEEPENRIYSHKFEQRNRDIDKELIEKFIPFTGFRDDQLYVLSTRKEYMDFIFKAISEFE